MLGQLQRVEECHLLHELRCLLTMPPSVNLVVQINSPIGQPDVGLWESAPPLRR